jgi:hypothetical protein
MALLGGNDEIFDNNVSECLIFFEVVSFSLYVGKIPSEVNFFPYI